MTPQKTKNAYEVQREVAAYPGVEVVYVSASGFLSGEHNNDTIELDMRNASSNEKSAVRELVSGSWTVTEGDDYWQLNSDYYPLSTEEMLKIRNPEGETA